MVVETFSEDLEALEWFADNRHKISKKVNFLPYVAFKKFIFFKVKLKPKCYEQLHSIKIFLRQLICCADIL